MSLKVNRVRSRWLRVTAGWTRRTRACCRDCRACRSRAHLTTGYRTSGRPPHLSNLPLPSTPLICITPSTSATVRAPHSYNSHHSWTAPTGNGSRYKYKCPVDFVLTFIVFKWYPFDRLRSMWYWPFREIYSRKIINC